MKELRVVDYTPFSEPKRFWLAVSLTILYAALLAPLIWLTDPLAREQVGLFVGIFLGFIVGGVNAAFLYRVLKGKRVDRGTEKNWFKGE